MGRAGELGTGKETCGCRLRETEGTDRHLEHMEAIGEGVPLN